MFVLAHLSDPHIPMTARPGAFEFLGKRMIGYANWSRSRHTIHRSDIASALVADLKAQAPDHIVMTGDLVNVAAAREWEAAKAYMAALGDGASVSAVPGNHDAYVNGGLAAMARTYAPYISPDERVVTRTDPPGPMTPPSVRPPDYPFVRQRGPVALIGVSTAVPTAPFMATGRIGHTQLEALDARLGELAQTRLYRVLLIHHPPTQALAHGRRGLSDADALGRIIARHGVDLVLHGHNHTATLASMPGPSGPVPVVGVPSASARPHGRKPGAGYALIEIDGPPSALQVTLVRRGLPPDIRIGEPVGLVELSREAIAPARVPA